MADRTSVFDASALQALLRTLPVELAGNLTKYRSATVEHLFARYAAEFARINPVPEDLAAQLTSPLDREPGILNIRQQRIAKSGKSILTVTTDIGYDEATFAGHPVDDWTRDTHHTLGIEVPLLNGEGTFRIYLRATGSRDVDRPGDEFKAPDSFGIQAAWERSAPNAPELEAFGVRDRGVDSESTLYFIEGITHRTRHGVVAGGRLPGKDRRLAVSLGAAIVERSEPEMFKVVKTPSTPPHRPDFAVQALS